MKGGQGSESTPPFEQGDYLTFHLHTLELESSESLLITSD